MSSSTHAPAAAPCTVDLDDQLCFALYAATNLITRSYRPLLDELGITYPQYLVLLVLWHEESKTNGELADQLLLAPHAITPLVDRLSRAGLVTRRRDRSDRRVVHVTLTAAGRALEARVSDIQQQVGCHIAMPMEDIVALRTQLKELIANLSQPAPER